MYTPHKKVNVTKSYTIWSNLTSKESPPRSKVIFLPAEVSLDYIGQHTYVSVVRSDQRWMEVVATQVFSVSKC